MKAISGLAARAVGRGVSPSRRAGSVRALRDLHSPKSRRLGGDASPYPLRGLALAITFVGLAVVAHAQIPDPVAAAAKDPAVELPPLMVTESPDAPPWLYAQVNGMEYLSRCSIATTRAYAEQWEHALQRLWLFVPDWLLPRREIAGSYLLYSQKLAQSTSPELLQALKNSAATGGGPFGRDYGGDLVYRFAPNMRISDRDVYSTFSYIDEVNFDPTRMNVAPGYVNFMLERRVPELPAWFIVGVTEIYRSAQFSPKEVTLAPFFWVDYVQTSGLSRDPDFPRALLPASELFAHDALRGKVNGNFRRVETLKAQAALFVRWAIETGPATREALWKFAARAAEEPPSEELFTACFGFGFSELRDRLSDYVPQAVKESAHFEPGKFPRVPRVAVRHATPGEIARLRGEWERLAATYVQKQSPQLHPRYLEQARRTLRKAFDAGDRDSRLLTALGLCELAANDMVATRFFLEPAIAAGVNRPRAYYELARVRYADLRRSDAERLFSVDELASVLAPLRTALQQRPLLPEAFALFGDAWLRCNTAPSPQDFALLETGARMFARQTETSLPLALALARHGRKEVATSLLAVGADYGRDESTRQRFVQLRETLSPAP